MIDILKIRPKSTAIAQAFIGTSAPLRELGWGVSGMVFESPKRRTAVKVHHHPTGYSAEVKAYRILRQHRVETVSGLVVPMMWHSDDAKQFIEIDIVNPPYLLDFAGATFVNPDFSSDTQYENHREIEERFGPNAHIAYAVHTYLRRFGIFYTDLRPSNVNVTGHPSAVPWPLPGDSSDDSFD